MIKLIFYICTTLVLSCVSTQAIAQNRHFYMGFTSWPFDMTVNAVDWVYQSIHENGDIVSHHIEEGVPWPEALNGQAFAKDYLNSLQQRIDKTQKGKKLFLSVSPINTARSGLADYRGSGINMSLPAPWKTYRLNSDTVKTAYFNYLNRMIEMFHPDYLAIGIEVNLLIRNNSALWSDYLDLHKSTYAQLKKKHPSLPILVSVDVNALLQNYSTVDNHTAQTKALQELLPYLDILGISLHPVMSRFRTDPLPTDMFDKIFALTNKPIALTESSYSAQAWSIVANGSKVQFNGSVEKQNDFIHSMLAAAQSKNCPFVIIFSIRDYDALWTALGKPDAALPWRDSGLYDEAGLARPALITWKKFLQKKYVSKQFR